MSTVPDYCWSISDFWLNEAVFVRPFDMFVMLTTLHFIWLYLEVYLLVKSKQFHIVKSSVLLGVFALLISLSYVHNVHWQSMRYKSGEISFDDFWSGKSHEWFSFWRGFEEPLNTIDWYDFKYQQRCQNGLGLYDITDDEYEELYQAYDKLFLLPINPTQ